MNICAVIAGSTKQGRVLAAHHEGILETSKSTTPYAGTMLTLLSSFLV